MPADPWIVSKGSLPCPLLTACSRSPPVAANRFPARASALYYGVLDGGAGFSLVAGQVVWASIDGRLCGVGQTQAVHGRIVYALDVATDLALPGCGLPGRRVRIALDRRVLARDVAWDNQQALEFNLARP